GCTGPDVLLSARPPLDWPSRGEVAQLVEHTAENRGVAGSSPALAISLPVAPVRNDRHLVARSGVEETACVAAADRDGVGTVRVLVHDQVASLRVLERLRNHGVVRIRAEEQLDAVSRLERDGLHVVGAEVELEVA